jgi:hypothetical protein
MEGMVWESNKGERREEDKDPNEGKKGKVVPVLNQALHHEYVQRSGYIDPSFLDLSTSWR